MVTLTCDLDGNPPPEITWLHEDQDRWSVSIICITKLVFAWILMDLIILIYTIIFYKIPINISEIYKLSNRHGNPRRKIYCANYNWFWPQIVLSNRALLWENRPYRLAALHG